MAAEDGGGGGRSNPISRFFMNVVSKDSEFSAEDIRDLKELSQLLGGLGETYKSRGLRKLSKFFLDLADYERDYLTPSELGFCVGTLLFLGGILTAFYKLYMFLSEEEDRIIRESLRRRRGNNGGNNNGNGNNGSNGNGDNSSGDGGNNGSNNNIDNGNNNET